MHIFTAYKGRAFRRFLKPQIPKNNAFFKIFTIINGIFGKCD